MEDADERRRCAASIFRLSTFDDSNFRGFAMASFCLNNDERYQQASLDLTTLAERAWAAQVASQPCQSVRPRSQFHTLVSSNRRLCDDLWGEYRLECAFREREGLPFVSLPEFERMRDWADRLDEPQDVAWPAVPDDTCAEKRRRAM